MRIPTMAAGFGLITLLFALRTITAEVEGRHLVVTVIDSLLAFSFGNVSVLFAARELFGIPTGVFFKPDRGGLGGLYAKIVLAPYRAICWSVLGFFRLLGDKPISQVSDWLYISGRLFERDRKEFEAEQISAVLDVCAELPEAPFIKSNSKLKYLCIPVPDNSPPTEQELDRALEFLLDTKQRGGKALVHCAYGHGRSAVVCAAALVATGEAQTVDDALKRLFESRDSVKLSGTQEAFLRRFVAKRAQAAQ